MQRRPLIESIWVVETSVPWAAFKAAEYNVSIATENGKVPECDKKMVEGITQKLLVRRDPIPDTISHSPSPSPVTPPSALARILSGLMA